MKSLLKVTNVTKIYHDFALKGVNLEIGPGEVVGLVGTNGAGKTTLIKSILGHIFINEGTISLFDQEANRGATTQMREKIGVVFDTGMLPKAFSLSDVVKLMKVSYRSWDPYEFKRYYELLNISSFKKTEELSRGNSMKLSIACALASKPQLLLLDEATAGLDPMVREEVLQVLRDYQTETDCGILMCTHITSDLEKIADRVICLDEGQIVFSCNREDITDTAGLARCRSVDVEALGEMGYFMSGAMHYEKAGLGMNVLVPDRFDFKKAFPEIDCDRCTIEDYMRIMLKGEVR